MKGVKGEIDQRPKRFYRTVDIARADRTWAVTLDGRAIKTPARHSLVLPTQALAEIVAQEWRRQDERIDLQSMFATRMANVSIDRTPGCRGELADEAASFAETDLVCHVAEGPADLRRLQEIAWTPLRNWAAETLGVRLVVVEGVMAAKQPRDSLEAVRNHAAGLDDFRLTALVYGVALLGSAVLGLAAERRRLTAVEAHEMGRIDEAFQAGLWGEDDEAVRRTQRSRDEAAALDLWFDGLDRPAEAAPG
ncbi:MAG: ATP12 family protein [Alphaproteobacteria bacterium]|nr:ATP12 family protein [Alphaproteobacteria bacterium]